MSWFSSALHGIGHLAEKAAPIVGLIPGVGTLAGGAIGGLGGLLSGDGIGGALRGGAEGALSGYGGGLLRGAGGAASALPGAVAGGGLGEGAVGTGLGGIADAAIGGGGGGIASSIEGILGGAGKQLLGNGGMNLLGVAQGFNAANLGKKANDYTNQAINSAQNAYNEKSGIRQQALAGLQNPTPPNLSNLSQIASALPQAPANYAGSATTADPSKLQPLAFAGAQSGGQGGAAPAMSLAQLQQMLNSGKRFS